MLHIQARNQDGKHEEWHDENQLSCQRITQNALQRATRIVKVDEQDTSDATTVW